MFRKLKSGYFAVRVEHKLLDGIEPRPGDGNVRKASKAAPRRPRRRCNDLSGEEWLRSSISVWSDIRKTAEEAALNHPAMFPTMLCERLILMFLRRKAKHRILDPFVGSGSVVLAARNLSKVGIDLDINDEYLRLGRTIVCRTASNPSESRASAGAE